MNSIAERLLPRKTNYESIKYILVNAVVLLIIAQFDFKYFGTKNALMIPIIMAFLMILNQYIRKSIFVFILIIFIGSHFPFLSGFGGTFSIVAFMVLIYNYLQKIKMAEISYRDNTMRFIFLILIIFTLLGWILKSKMIAIDLLFAAVAFFSFVLMFFLCSKIIWTEKRTEIFSILISIIIGYALFTAIVNTMHLIPFSSGLWYGIDVEFNPEGSFFYSMINRPTTAVGAMYFSFLAPFLLVKNKSRYFKQFRSLLLLGVISSVLVCIGGFSKSHSVVLGVAFLLIPFMLSFKFRKKMFFMEKYFLFIGLMILLYFILQPFFHFETLKKRFDQQPDFIKNFIENPLLPKNTTREESFSLAQESLQRENWFIGYGYANAGLNRIAWLGDNSFGLNRSKKDFHNTYYSLPQLFGWLGALAYLAIFIISIRRMFVVFKNNKVILDYRIFAFSFFMLFLIHLMTEYSITALSSPYYLMMLFILLGLANSLFYNYKKGMLNHVASESKNIETLNMNYSNKLRNQKP